MGYGFLKMLAVTAMIAFLFFLFAAAVVLFVFAVRLLAPLAGRLLSAPLFVLGGLALPLSLAAFAAVSVCHKIFRKAAANTMPRMPGLKLYLFGGSLLKSSYGCRCHPDRYSHTTKKQATVIATTCFFVPEAAP